MNELSLVDGEHFSQETPMNHATDHSSQDTPCTLVPQQGSQMEREREAVAKTVSEIRQILTSICYDHMHDAEVPRVVARIKQMLVNICSEEEAYRLLGRSFSSTPGTRLDHPPSVGDNAGDPVGSLCASVITQLLDTVLGTFLTARGCYEVRVAVRMLFMIGTFSVLLGSVLGSRWQRVSLGARYVGQMGVLAGLAAAILSDWHANH